MTPATAPTITVIPADLDERRLAVENAIGAMRLENLEPDETTQRILFQFAKGDIDLSETNRQLDEYTRARCG